MLPAIWKILKTFWPRLCYCSVFLWVKPIFLYISNCLWITNKLAILRIYNWFPRLYQNENSYTDSFGRFWKLHATYLNEQNVLNWYAAAALADEYVLTHKNVSFCIGLSFAGFQKCFVCLFQQSMSSPVCFYCKKWFINDILTTVGRTSVVSFSTDMCEDVQFMMNGFVSLAGNASSRRPIKKLWHKRYDCITSKFTWNSTL